jgi:hypothetical protein
MSVLKKIQFADASRIGVASFAIIGAGAADCQNQVLHAANAHRTPPCFIAAR